MLLDNAKDMTTILVSVLNVPVAINLFKEMQISINHAKKLSLNAE
jgi:hypothetical protein